MVETDLMGSDPHAAEKFRCDAVCDDFAFVSFFLKLVVDLTRFPL